MASGFCCAARLTNCGVHALRVQEGRDGGNSREGGALLRTGTITVGLSTTGRILIVLKEYDFVPYLTNGGIVPN